MENRVTSETPSDVSLGGISLSLTQKISTAVLSKKLVGFGYESMGTANVFQHGQFGQRGGVVDIWLERYNFPVRLDFIGDKIEAI